MIHTAKLVGMHDDDWQCIGRHHARISELEAEAKSLKGQMTALMLIQVSDGSPAMFSNTYRRSTAMHRAIMPWMPSLLSELRLWLNRSYRTPNDLSCATSTPLTA